MRCLARPAVLVNHRPALTARRDTCRRLGGSLAARIGDPVVVESALGLAAAASGWAGHGAGAGTATRGEQEQEGKRVTVASSSSPSNVAVTKRNDLGACSQCGVRSGGKIRPTWEG